MSVLARWCHAHRIAVVLVWLVAALGLGAAALTGGAAFDNGTAADQAKTGNIVWTSDSGSGVDRSVQDQLDPLIADIGQQRGVASVKSPNQPASQQISADRTTAYATVTFAPNADEAAIEKVKSLAENARIEGVSIALGGQAFDDPISISIWSEIVGVGAALAILLLMFRSLWAGLLPIIVAVAGVLTALFATMLLSHVMTLPDTTPTMGALIGLGVGIDYALFIVYRHRRGLMRGRCVRDSIAQALDTSGRAVIFAGLTVVVALLGMLTLGVQILSGMALGAALTVLLTMLSATTLLPAIVSLLGTRVLGRGQRAQLAAGRHEADDEGRWKRWADSVAERPKLTALVAFLLLAALALPALDIRLGSADAGSQPESTSSRQAYDMLSDGFGPGFNGPVILTADTPDSQSLSAFDRLVSQLPAVEGVERVEPLAPARTGQGVSSVTIIPTGSPQSEETAKLVDHLRDNLLPRAEQGTSMHVTLAGVTASNADFASDLSSKIPRLLAIISILGIVLLVLAFRSVLIPAVGAVLNLITIAIAFGAIVLVFQRGLGIDLLGVGSAAPIEPVVPVLIVGVMFGLSMDYQVFLVSRMHEEWGRNKNNLWAVTVGQTHTAPVLAAAASIMFCVFAAFAGGGVRLIAQFGLGLAVAVLFDVFIVRMALVPAIMHTLGKANWWLPKTLDRRLPHVSIEGNGDDNSELSAARETTAEAAGGS